MGTTTTPAPKTAAVAAKEKKGKAKATAKAKAKSKYSSSGKLILGCSKCRGLKKGCGNCRDPNFNGKRGHA